MNVSRETIYIVAQKCSRGQA